MRDQFYRETLIMERFARLLLMVIRSSIKLPQKICFAFAIKLVMISTLGIRPIYGSAHPTAEN